MTQMFMDPAQTGEGRSEGMGNLKRGEQFLVGFVSSSQKVEVVLGTDCRFYSVLSKQ